MSRKGKVVKREVLSDPRYNDRLVARCVNHMMRKGKKSVAQSILYQAFDRIKQKTKDDPLKIFRKALDNVKPVLEVRSRRVGGATYQVPVEVRPERRISLAMKWLMAYAEARGERSMVEKFSEELIDAANNKGGAVKKREDVHKMAEANKVFAHYRW
ncbi:MAG: 30S ribosomal protein S7 [Deltaproteobacteria bacterium]|nr:30S ribosomal protein S7 [Deltaproteobacteria bacterium]